MRWASLLVAACGTDTDPGCSPTVTYRTVGAPFVESWCRGCHSIDVPAAMRQRAPNNINFDTLADIRARLLDVDASVAGHTMPPAGGPTEDERALMTTWLRCGAAP